MLGNLYKRYANWAQLKHISTSGDKADIHVHNRDLVGAGLVVIGALVVWGKIRSRKNNLSSQFETNEKNKDELIQCNIMDHYQRERELKKLKEQIDYLESKLIEERSKSEELNNGFRTTINEKDNEIERLRKEMDKITDNLEMVSQFQNENAELERQVESLVVALDETKVIKDNYNLDPRISEMSFDKEAEQRIVRRSSLALREKQMRLKLINHYGHLTRRFSSDCKPENLLNSNIDSYYSSKTGVNKNDWMIFKMDHEHVYYPTKVKLFSNGENTSPQTIMFFIGKGDSNNVGDWMMLNAKPFKYKKRGGKQTFNFDFTDKIKRYIKFSKYNCIKINIIDNYGDAKFIQINQLQIYGVQI